MRLSSSRVTIGSHRGRSSLSTLTAHGCLFRHGERALISAPCSITIGLRFLSVTPIVPSERVVMGDGSFEAEG